MQNIIENKQEYNNSNFLEVIEELKNLIAASIKQNTSQKSDDVYEEEYDWLIKEYEEKGLSINDVPEHAFESLSETINQVINLSKRDSEYFSARKYLETLLSIPWKKKTNVGYDVAEAIAYVESRIFLSPKLKQRLLELFAVRKHCIESKSQPILLLGPPGVAKTLLAANIAKAMNRNSAKIFLGGETDAHRIKGFLRTYTGSSYGKIIKSLIDTKSLNCVIILEEIDKIPKECSHGNPLDALLEVLDNTQNHSFTDTYLDVAVDISDVLFIATANYIEQVSEALLDRMEIIEMPGYGINEKMNIIKNYTIPKFNREMKINVCFDDSIIKEIIEDHSFESGMRNIETSINEIYRKIITKIHVEKHNISKFTHINKNSFKYYCQEKPKHLKNVITEAFLQPGTLHAMAYIKSGIGQLCLIEAEVLQGIGIVKSTGNLGNMVDETIKVVLTYIRKNYKYLDISKTDISNNDIHIHISGSAPKNGSSIGVACFISIFSAISGLELPSNLAVTGEISLKGKILPVGKIKEKVTSAYEAGIKQIILPKGNSQCIEDIDLHIRKKLEFLFFEDLMEVYKFIKRLKPKDVHKEKNRRIQDNFEKVNSTVKENGEI